MQQPARHWATRQHKGMALSLPSSSPVDAWAVVVFPVSWPAAALSWALVKELLAQA